MAAKDAIPNNPKNPDTITVNALIGMCSPIAPPNTLKKNKNKIPIPNLIVPCAKNRIGLMGAPTNNKTMISATIMDMTIVELILIPSLSPF